jgi:hypothetical protein
MPIVKTVYRLFKYRAEWYKQFREIQIRKQQKSDLKKLNTEATRLIVFFIPGADYQTGKEAITGGLISIISLAEETRKIFIDDASTEVVCCTYFGDHLLYKLTTFENTTPIFNYKQLPKYFKKASSILFHLPELFVEDFYTRRFQELKFNPDAIQLNILNQNINLMPPDVIIGELKKKVISLTITTAHKKYCTPAFQQRYDVPLHLLSVWISPENYIKTHFSDKKDIILFSPDNRALTITIIQLLNLNLPQYETHIISGLSYETYKEKIREAKFVITTGEGLDAYFIETFFSGGVCIAIKNLDFFDLKYQNLELLLSENEINDGVLISLLHKYQNQEIYDASNRSVFDLLTEDYSYKNYVSNLSKFYFKEYTFQ